MSAAARKRHAMLAAAHRAKEARDELRTLLVTGKGGGGIRREEGRAALPMIVDDAVPFFIAAGERGSLGGPSENRARFSTAEVAVAARMDARSNR